MRTTVRLDDALFMRVKGEAVASGRTLTAVIEDALRESLSPRKRAVGVTKTKLTTVDGQGLCPGVDIDRTTELLDLMEQA